MFQWFKEGDPVALVESEHFVGVNTRELCILNVQTDDTGTYVLLYDDGSKAPAQYSVLLTVSAGLPVAGGLMLGLLAGASALGGAMALYRRKRL
jgi:hypothetical protein